MREAVAEAEKVAEVPSTDPYIVSVVDSVNDTVDTVTVGSAMRLVGGKLKFDMDCPVGQPTPNALALGAKEQGVFVTQEGATVRDVLPP